MSQLGGGLSGAAIAGAGLALVLLLFFAEAMPSDRVLAPSDMIFDSAFFESQRPEGLERASNPLLGDQAYQFIPWRRYSWSRMRAGEVPHWNPASYSGTPFLATMQSAVFSPFQLTLLAMPFERGFLWSALLKLWVAGFGTYLLLRRYELAWIPSFYGALAFMLSGFLVSWLGHPHTSVLVWLPAILLATELLVTAPSARRRLAPIGLLGLLAGAATLGGHPESVQNAAFLATLYAAVRGWQWLHRGGGEWLKRYALLGLSYLGAWLLAAGIAALQLLPFLEWLSVSNELATRSGKAFSWWTPQALDQLLSLLVAIYPNIYNNPTWDAPYWSFLFQRSNYNEMALYAGVLTLGLALLSLRARQGPARDWLITWWILGLVSLGRVLRVPPFEWLNSIPPLSMVQPGRLRVGLSLAICVLAAIGLDALLRGLAEDAAGLRWLRRYAFLPVLVGSAMILGGLLVLPRLRSRIVDFGRDRVDAELAARGSAKQPLEHYYAEVDRMADGLVAAFHPSNLEMYAPLLVAIAAIVLVSLWLRAGAQPRWQAWFGASLLLLLLVDLFVAGRGYNPVVAQADFYPAPELATPDASASPTGRPAQQGIEARHGRALALQQDLLPDAHMMLGDAGWRDLRGLDYPTRWTRDYLDAIPENIPWLAYGSILSGASSGLARLPNLEWVLSARRAELEELDGVDEILDAPPMYAARLSDPVPRALLARDVRLSDDSLADVQELAREPGSLPGTVVVASEGLDSAAREALQDLQRQDALPLEDAAGVTVVEDLPEALTLRVDVPRDAFLFVSDAYYPGWSATVDGRQTQLYRAQHAFRGVIVPAGEHEIRFRYEGMWFRRGLWISVASLLLAVAMIGLGLRPARAEMAS